MMCSIIIEALAKFGIDADYKPPNDVTVNGKKISGNAQTVRDKAVLMHGTIILDLDLELMSYILKEKKPGYVTSIRKEFGTAPSMEEMMSSLKTSFERGIGAGLEKALLTGFETSEIDRLIKERYGTDEWNFKR